MTRETTEAWHTGTNSINRCVALPEAYRPSGRSSENGGANAGYEEKRTQLRPDPWETQTQLQFNLDLAKVRSSPQPRTHLSGSLKQDKNEKALLYFINPKKVQLISYCISLLKMSTEQLGWVIADLHLACGFEKKIRKRTVRGSTVALGSRSLSFMFIETSGLGCTENSSKKRRHI
ncbi:hypothetical protein SprV_0501906300 [Sparganum proliferum]